MNSNYIDCLVFFLEFDGLKIEISEPVKFDQLRLTLDRHEMHGFNPNVIKDGLSLGFENTEVSNAKDIILDRYYNFGGNDSEIYFLFGQRNQEPIFRGKINFNSFLDNLQSLQVSAERTAFEDLIRTRIEVPINIMSEIDIDGEYSAQLTPIEQNLHSKKLRKSYVASEDYDSEFPSVYTSPVGFTRFAIQGSPSPLPETEFNDDTVRAQIGEFLDILIDEIPVNNNIPFGWTKESYEEGGALEDVGFITFSERGDYSINLVLNDFKVRLFANVISAFMDCNNELGSFNGWNYNLYFLSRNADRTTKSKISVFDSSLPNGCYSFPTAADIFNNVNFNHSESFEAGDDFIFYIEIYVFGTFRKKLFFTDTELTYQIEILGDGNKLEVKAETQIQETSANLFLKHEVYEKVIRDISGEEGRFKSPVLGRTDSTPAYPEDGKYSLQALTNGFQIRQFPIGEKPPYFSLIDLLEHDSYCNALGYDFIIEDGRQKIYIADWQEFYLDEDIFIQPLTVSDYSIEINKDAIWNELEIGFESWAKEELNNLDEFASKSIYNSGIKSYKRKIQKISKILASGYLIEILRRNGYSEFSSQDNDFDNSNFVIALIRDIDGFITEKDENYIIGGVFSPETVYNAVFSRSQMLFRQLRYLCSAIARKGLNHEIRHIFGEGNNLASFQNSEYDLQENQNFTYSDFIAIFTPEIFNISALISFSQYLSIKENRYKTIHFLDDCGAVKRGWIQSLDYDPNDNILKLKLLSKNE